MLVHVLARSWNKTTNFSRVRKVVFTCSCEGQTEMWSSTSVNLSYCFHVFHVLFFPRSAKKDTSSHPVNAWNNGKEDDVALPKFTAIGCIGMYRWLFLASNHNHNSVKFNFVKSATAITSASVSTAPTKTLVLPETLAFRMCKKILVSASYFVRETRVGTLTLPLDTTIFS